MYSITIIYTDRIDFIINSLDMIWANKLAKANTSARGMMSQARRLATDPDGSCLKYLDIGDPNSKKKGFNGADDIN